MQLLLTYEPRPAGVDLSRLEAKCAELTYLQRRVDTVLARMVDTSPELQNELSRLSELANALHLVYASAIHSERTVYVGEETLGLRALIDKPSPALSTLEQARVKAYYRKLASHYHPNGSSGHADPDMHRVVYAAYKAGSLETLYLLASRAGLVLSSGAVSVDTLLGSVNRKLADLQARESFHIARLAYSGLISSVRAHSRLLKAIRTARAQLVLSLTRNNEPT